MKPIVPSGYSTKNRENTVTDQIAEVEIKMGAGKLHATSRDELIMYDSLSFDVILGVDWMERHGVVMDISRGTVTSQTFGDLTMVRKVKFKDTRSIRTLTNMISSVRTNWLDEDTPWGESKEFDEVDEDVAVSAEELKEVPEEFHQYGDVFSKKKADRLPPFRPHIDLMIELDGDIPPSLKQAKYYRLSHVENEALSDYLADMLKKGFIRPSTSPIASPGFFVPKPHSKELRFVVDYKRLNTVTTKDKYTLPLIADILHFVGKGRIFSKVDLRGAYNLMRVAEGDEWKTAFCTPQGSYEYLAMPFGLCNAPSAFQRWMNSIFGDLIPRKLMVYLDDIIVFSQDEQEHRATLHELFKRLRENRLYTAPKKCEFFKTELHYLGHVISAEGISMDNSKVECIESWPTPDSIKAIQRFLGFANWYRGFIKSFSELSAPLTRLLKSSTREALGIKSESQKFTLPQDAIYATESLKRAFINAPLLTHWSPGLVTVVETDASNFALGAILSQEHESALRPVAYFSRSFKPAEVNYDVHDKELLSVVEALRAWRPYLAGSHFRIVTDHKNLEYFRTTKELTPRQVRWSIFLAMFDFHVEYRPGHANGRCDALSRREDLTAEAVSAASNVPQNLSAMGGPRQSGKPRARVFGTLLPGEARTEGGGDGTSVQPPTPFSDLEAHPLLTLSHYSRFQLEEDDLTQQIKKAHAELPREFIQELPKREGYYTTVSGSHPIVWHMGVLYVPEIPALRTQAIERCHAPEHMGHPGTRKTEAILRRYYSWPGLSNDVRAYVKACESCTRNKPTKVRPHAPLRPLELADAPWSSVSMDRITQLPESNGFTSILVITDRFSKMAIFVPVQDTYKAEDLSKDFIHNVIYHWGVPREVISDRGPEFTALLWKAVCEKLGIRSKTSTAYHPQTDGQTERLNQTLEVYLRHYVNYHQDNWASLLPIAAFCYNCTPHSATLKTPFEVVCGYTPTLGTTHITELGVLHSTASSQETWKTTRQCLEDARDASMKHFNKKVGRLPQWNVGDRVWLSAKNLRTRRPTKKLDHQFVGPFPIEEKVSTHAYRLKLPSSMRIHNVFHISLLRKCVPTLPGSSKERPPDPVEVEGDLEYEIEAIIAERESRRGVSYLVKWKGYSGEESTTWEPADELNDTEALDNYLQAKEQRLRRVQQRRGQVRTARN
ncbi:unnamed protein product [Parajaminaea phylloscopi]